ncbi:MAG: hypothetical protein V7642_7055, partial [Burkholderiales bacterium]
QQSHDENIIVRALKKLPAVCDVRMGSRVREDDG